MTPSNEQSAICEHVRASPTNLVVEAAPGSGKTTTIGMAARGLPLGHLYVALAFAKANAEDFQRKLPLHVMSSTFHSLCKRTLDACANGAKPKVVADKVKFILKDNFPDVPWPLHQPVLRLVSLLKQQTETLSPDEIADLAAIFDVDVSDPRVIPTSERVLTLSDADAARIDFDDMLRFGLRPGVTFPRYALVFLDEAQDTNGVQRALLTKMNTRVVAVGDPHQSIYGFRGADHDAMNALRIALRADVLPLSVSYRCSQSVVAEAQRVLQSPKFKL